MMTCRKAAVAAAMLGACLCAWQARAAGPKANGTVELADDLPTGLGAGVSGANAGPPAREVSGSLGQFLTIIGESLLPGATLEAGYFSMGVSTPASASYAQVFFTSITVQWTNAVPANPSGTLYRVELSTAANFSGVVFSSAGFGLSTSLTGLARYTAYYARVKATYMDGDESSYVALGSTSTFPDNTAPQATITSPANDAFVGSGLISGGSTDSDPDGAGPEAPSGVASVQISIQRSLVLTCWDSIDLNWSADCTNAYFTPAGTPASWNYTIPLPSLTNLENYTAKARATDNAGNIQTVFPVGTSQVTFTYSTSGRFQGKVTKQDGTTPLSGVSVDVIRASDDGVDSSALTAGDGTYSVNASVPGTYHLRTQPSGYFPSQRFNYAIGAGTTVTRDFALQSSGEAYRDTFTATTGWTQPFGATSLTSNGNVMKYRSVLSGGGYHGILKSLGATYNNGTYPFVSIRNKVSLNSGKLQTVDLTFDYCCGWTRRQGFASGFQSVPWQDGTYAVQFSWNEAFLINDADDAVGTADVDHYLDYLIIHTADRGYVAGTVRDATSAPIANARVELLVGTAQVGEVQTDALGNYTIWATTDPAYTVRGSAPGPLSGAQGGVTVAGRTQTTVNLTLTPITVAISTPSFPGNGAYVSTSGFTFDWLGPSTAVVAGLGSGASYYLEVSNNDPAFAPGNMVVSIATPAVVQSLSPSDGAYSSTYTLSEATTYYWRLRARDSLGSFGPYSQTYSFVTDFTPPTQSAAFSSISSTAGVLGEGQFNNLASGVTAHISVQDGESGLAVSSSAPASSGDGHSGYSGSAGGYGVMYSTNAGQTWIDAAAANTASVGSAIYGLAVFNDKLYAGGYGNGKVYSSADGVAWDAGTAVGVQIMPLTVFNGKLYVGDSSNGKVYSSSDGAAWSVGIAVGVSIQSLGVFNGKLYAGDFNNGKIYSSADGLTWSAGVAVGANISALMTFNGKLYAGDWGSLKVYSSADGDAWSAVTPALDRILALAVFNGKLYAGDSNGRVYSSADGATWGAGLMIGAGVNALAAFNGKLYAGDLSGRTYSSADGLTWSAGAAAGNPIFALASFKGKLYVGHQNGLVDQLPPVPAALTGSDGATGAQTLSATSLSLVQSTNSLTCGGVSPCGATNQVIFTASDLAGNVKSAGPFAVIVDEGAPVPGCAAAVNVRKNGIYRTISSGLAALPNALAGDACVVVRDTQTYSEQITVQNFVNNGFQLKIMADPSFVSSAPVVSPPALSTAAFRILNDSVTLQGLTVRPAGSTSYGVFASSAYVTISSVNVDSAGNIGTAGIAITSNSLVTNSSVTVQNAHGLWATGSSNSVTYSSVAANGVSKYALWLQGASSNTVTRSLISNPAGYGARLDSGADYNTISDSIMTSNAGSGYSALYITSSDSNTVTRSLISNPAGYGAYLYGGADYNTISDSTMTSNAGGDSPTLYIFGSNWNTVTRSFISNPAGYGAWMRAGDNILSQSTFTSNAAGYSALYLLGSDRTTLTGSYVQGSTAVWVSGSIDTVVNSNVLVGSLASGAGLWLSGGSINLSMSSNSVAGGAQGRAVNIDVNNSGTISLSTNTIRGGACGVAVSTQMPGAQVWITSNTILPSILNTADSFGIMFDGLRTGATVYNNEILYRAPGPSGAYLAFGIGARSASGLVVSHNRISNPDQVTGGTYIGIGLDDADNVDIAFNDVYGARSGTLDNAFLLWLVDGSTGVRVRNNVFRASFTVTGSSAMFSISADSTQDFLSDYNAFYADTDLRSARWGGAAKTIAQSGDWQALGFDVYSVMTHPRWANLTPGAEDFHPLSRAGRFLAGSPTQYDSFTAGTLDAADPALGAGSEPGPNGGRMNLGSYGGTLEASQTPAKPGPPSIAAVYSSSATIAWDAVGSDGYRLDASPQPDFSAGVVSSVTANGALDRLTAGPLAANTTYYFRVAARWGDFLNYEQAVQPSTATLAAYPLAITPADLRFVGVSTGSFTSLWDAGGNAQGTTYFVRLSTSASDPAPGASVFVSTVPWGPPGVGFGSLAANASYYVWAAAENRGGALTPYAMVGDTRTLAALPATAVTTFTAVWVGSATVAWDGNGNSAGTRYVVRLSTSGTDWLAPFSSGVSTEPEGAPVATVDGLAGNTTYYLHVSAVARDGGALAPVVLGSTATLAASPAAAPQPFVLVHETSMTVSWSANGNAVGVTTYTVVLSTSPAYPNTDLWTRVLASTLPPGAFPAATLAGLTINTSYYLLVSAINLQGVGTPFVRLASTWTMAAQPGAAAIPLTEVNVTSVTAQWTAGANAAGTEFQLFASTDPEFGGVVAGGGWTVALSSTLYDLSGDTTYYLRAVARNGAGVPSFYRALGSTITHLQDPGALPLRGVSPFGVVAAWSSVARGGELQGWRSLTALPGDVQGHAAAIVAGRVYVTGGSSGSGASAAVWRAALQPDGSLGGWTAATPLPAPRDSHAMAVWGGRLYVAGGADGSAQATVWSAPVLADGSVGAWTTVRPLPQPRMKLALVAHEGWLYAVGGDNGISPQPTVYAARIEPDGSLGSWSAAANALAPARSGHAAAVVNGRLYVSGGVGGALEASVAYATLSNGVVGAWTAGRAMPAGRTRHAMAAGAERLYVAGGHDGSAAAAAVWSAAVLPGGAVGPWVEHAALPEARFLGAAAMTGERLYALGGSDGAAAKSAVWLSSATGTEYLVERALVDTFAPVAEDSGWFHGQSYEFAGLSPNTTYYFRVSVRSGAGAVGAAVALGSTMTWAAVPGTALSTFTAVEISSIGVQWTLGANPAGTEFRAEASTAPDFSGAVGASAWAASVAWLFSGLSLNTSYYLRAQGRNALGVEGPPLFLGAVFTLSSAPVASTITAVQAAGFTLEWSTGNLPAWTRYEAQASTMADFAPIAASTVTVSSMTTFSGLPSAATFYARVRSINGSGVPSLFDVVVTTRTGLDAMSPSAPAGVSGIPSGAPDSVLVRWTAPGDDGTAGNLPPGSKFYIQWSAKPDAQTAWDPGFAQLVIDTGSVAAGSLVSAALSGLPAQSTVTFRVWARDEAGNLSPPSAAASAYSSPFSFTPLDGAAGDAGQSPSIAVDRSGNVHLAYRTASGELRYLRRAGGSWGAAQLPDPGVVAAEVALAVDNDGNPQIAYRDVGVGRIKVARFSGGWSLSIVEAGDFRLGGLVLDAEGNARLSYGDPAAPAVKVASWTEVGWSTGVAGATSVTLSALSLDPAQRAAVIYGNAGGVRYAMGPTWASGTVDPGILVASRPAVQVDSNGALWLAYADAASSKLRAGKYVLGGGSAIVPVDDAATSGGLALDGAGRPVVAYWNGQDRTLKYARFDGAAWSTGTVDAAGNVGEAAAIAIDGAGSVLIAYYDTSQGDLKFAEWAGGVAPAAGGNAAGRAMAPSAMAGAAVSQYQIQWTWTDNAAGELGFALYGSQLSSGPFSLIVDSVTLRASPGTGGTVSYIESGLTTGATYYRYAVVVTSGGVAASRLAAAFPFNTVDASSPTIANRQAGDDRWRRAANGLYDVDFADIGGTHLTKFQVRASTVAGGNGPLIVPYTDVVTAINADAFANDWPLPPAVFDALWEDATNYISVKVFDGNGNSAELVDAFYVLKDTSPPTLVNRQAGGDPAFRWVAGTVYDVDVVDKVSRLAAFQYGVSTRPVSADGGVRPWTDIALVGGATDYTPDWGVAFAALPSDVTSYVSVRAWDVAGGTATLLDAFYIRKDTAGPVVRIAFPANGVMLSALTQVAGTAYDWAGIGGVELSLQAVPGGNYWDGAGFNTPTRGFVVAAGTVSWTLPMGMAWPDTTQFEIVARSTDSLGNYSATYSTVTVQFDTTPPTAGVTAPAPNSGLRALGDLGGTAADSTAGVGSVEVRLRRNTDGLWWNWSGETWTNVAVSSIATGAANWTLAPTPGLKAYLTNGTSYFVAARAVDRAIPGNAGDFFANGSTFTFIDDTAPSAITDLAASSSAVSGRVQLLWTAPGDDGSAGNTLFGAFLVGYSTGSPATFSTTTAQMYVATASVVAGSRRGLDVTNLVAGTTYYLRVWSSDDAGNWSGLSNGATMQAGPPLANMIGGRVVKVSSEGITAVEIDCYDVNGALISSTFTVADGLGSFTLGSVPAGTFRVQAIWTADGIGSSVWQDNIQQGTSNLDFVLNLNYTLSTLTGTLGALAAQARPGAAPAFSPRAGGAPVTGGKVELFAQGKWAVEVSPDPTGRWTIPNLLPGKYGVRAFNGVTYTDIVEVALGEGELMEVGFVYNALPEQSVFAFPNPARSGTTFRFESPLTPIEAQVMVFDLGGQLVREIAGSEMTAAGPGLYHAPWDLRNSQGEPVASGVYLFTVKVKGGSEQQTARVTKKLAVVK